MSREHGLDDKDLQLVNLLQRDAWMTYAQIGDSVHLSASAVQRRIEKLKKAGIITGATATIDPSVLGRKIRNYLLLELHDDSKRALDRMVNELRACEEIAFVDLVTGKFDIIMAMDSVDMESFADFAMNKLNANPNIRHCWTLTRLKQLF